MAAHFKTVGPFALGKTSESIEAAELKRFWDDIEKNHKGLRDSIGVYVLMVGSGNAARPIYVGKAERGFRARLKPAHDAFRKARNSYEDQLLSILLIARVGTSRGRFSRKRERDQPLKSIPSLEVLLIRDFLLRGFDLINSKEKQFFLGLVVPGYLHDEGIETTTASSCLRRLMQSKSGAIR